MASPSTDNDDTIPWSKSPGNPGARGSPGQANRGAQPADSTNQGSPQPGVQQQQGPDLRKDDAQGGGGAGSGSSRSK
jgi:hypothetical protein